jgi:hypothetical protein
MKKIVFNDASASSSLHKLITYLVIIIVFCCNPSGTVFAEDDPKYSYLIMKVTGENAEFLTNIKITWLDLRDGVGPNDEFDIEQKNNAFSIKLPGPGTYFFTIEATGYKSQQNTKIKIKKDIETIDIVLKKNPKNTVNFDVFGPVASGFWYPNDKEDLKQLVETYLSNVKIEKKRKNIVAVIAPHAGFAHSGQGAAYAFKPLKNHTISRVIILAPSHMGGFRGLSILKADYYKTPLGLIKIDTDICDSLLQGSLISTRKYAHSRHL